MALLHFVGLARFEGSVQVGHLGDGYVPPRPAIGSGDQWVCLDLYEDWSGD